MPNIRVKPGLCLEKATLDFKLVVKEAETKKPTTERGFTEKSICVTGQWANDPVLSSYVNALVKKV